MSTFANKTAFSYLSDNDDTETETEQEIEQETIGQMDKEKNGMFDNVATQKNKLNMKSDVKVDVDNWETIAESPSIVTSSNKKNRTATLAPPKKQITTSGSSSGNGSSNSNNSTSSSTSNTKPATLAQPESPLAHHSLQRVWKMWSHLPHDPNWSLQSYSLLNTLTTVEQTIATVNVLPENMVKGCMLFVVRDGIAPMWEDPHNIGGGYFSYKIYNKNVCEVWRDVVYSLVGETLSQNSKCMNSITGVEISPKKNFCIIKIWMSTCEFQTPTIISSDLKGLPIHGCLFNKFNDKANGTKK